MLNFEEELKKIQTKSGSGRYRGGSLSGRYDRYDRYFT